jgi:hypothetical protein
MQNFRLALRLIRKPDRINIFCYLQSTKKPKNLLAYGFLM